MPPALPDDFDLRLQRHEAPESDDPPRRRAAVAAILRGEAGEREVLLMRRIEYPGDPWSGHVSLPGGTADPEDATLLETALRETREEVGLDLGRSARLLCRLRAFTAVAGSTIPLMDITPFVFRLEEDAEVVPGAEAEECFWLPLTRVLAGELDTEHRHPRHGVMRTHPAWRWGERVVWGMTYRMITDVLRAGGVPWPEGRATR